MSVDRPPAGVDSIVIPVVEPASEPERFRPLMGRLDEPAVLALLDGLLGATGRGEIIGSMAKASAALAPVAVVWASFRDPDEVWWAVARGDGGVSQGCFPPESGVGDASGRARQRNELPAAVGREVARYAGTGWLGLASEPIGAEEAAGALVLFDPQEIGEPRRIALRRIARFGTRALRRFTPPIDPWHAGPGRREALLAVVDRLPGALLDLPQFVRVVEGEVERALPDVVCRLHASCGHDELAGHGRARAVKGGPADAESDGARPRGEQTTATEDLPVRLGRRTIARLAIAPVAGARPDEATLLDLRHFADRLAPFLDVALRHAAVARDADTDGLTLLANHRAFYRALDQELARRDPSTPVSLVLFDIDGLKQVNDVQGHLAGDALLRQFARLVQANVRSTDLVARYGGDEFAVVMPDLGAEQAWTVGWRIRRALGKRSLTSQFLRPAAVSFGVATAPNDGTDATGLVAVADERLYATRGRRPEGGRRGGAAATPRASSRRQCLASGAEAAGSGLPGVDGLAPFQEISQPAALDHVALTAGRRTTP